MFQTLSLISLLGSIAFAAADYNWVDARQLTLHGQGFSGAELESPYDRLPKTAEHNIMDEVWWLSTNSAGLMVDFLYVESSNSSSIAINVTLRYDLTTMWHFPSTGVAGLDLFVFDRNVSSWRWVGTTHDNTYGAPIVTVMGQNLWTGAPSLYRLHLPTYNAPTTLTVGVEPNAKIWTAPFTPQATIIHYGTSILQGAVASRPGFAFTNMYSRGIGVEVFNQGYSGHGLMQTDVVSYQLQAKPQADIFILDCNPNMPNGSQIYEDAVAVVQEVRKTLPNAAIIMSEGSRYGAYWIAPSVQGFQDDKRAGLKRAFQELQGDGIKNLTYVDGDSLFTSDLLLTSPTVGGTHPTDLGMVSMAARWEEVVASVLNIPVDVMKQNALKRDAARTPGSVVEGVESGFDAIEPASKEQSTFLRTVVEDAMRLEDNYARTGSSAEPAMEVGGVQWTLGRDLKIINHPFSTATTPNVYSRFPLAANGSIPVEDWGLLLMSTGVAIGFETTSSDIALSYAVGVAPEPLWHMPASGTSGADIYRFDESTSSWRFVACVEDLPTQIGVVKNTTLITNLNQSSTIPSSYLLHLPLRNYPLRDLAIGTIAGTTIKPLADYPKDTMVVWEGTSIEQGGVAARPGQTYTSVISRTLGITVANFGRAGNGRMQTDICSFLNTLNGTTLFMVDDNPNLDGESILKLGVPYIETYRSKQTDNIIVMTGGTEYGDDFLYDNNAEKRADLLQVYNELVQKGVKNIHYLNGTNLFLPTANSPPYCAPVVGGTHPSALGHQMIANFYVDFFPTLLENLQK